VILNGLPATGKSTVAKRFQSVRYAQHGELWLHIELDTFELMFPQEVGKLQPAEYEVGLEAMRNALRGLVAVDADVMFELVARDDTSVRQIVDSIVEICAVDRQDPVWITLLADHETRRSRNEGRARQVDVAPTERLDAAATANSTLVLHTDELSEEQVVRAIERTLSPG